MPHFPKFYHKQMAFSTGFRRQLLISTLLKHELPNHSIHQIVLPLNAKNSQISSTGDHTTIVVRLLGLKTSLHHAITILSVTDIGTCRSDIYYVRLNITTTTTAQLTRTMTLSIIFKWFETKQTNR